MAYLHPALASGRTMLRQLCAREGVQPGDCLVLAVSGGSDSMAVAHIARFVARKDGYRLVAVTVDHAVRPESSREAAQVASWLKNMGIEDVRIRRVSLDGRGGPEASARNARYHALDQVAQETGGVVLLGHTADDQAETVLLGLTRGSGPRSISGMENSAPLPTSTAGTVAFRPVLHLRRRDLRQALREENIPWVDDPSNAPDGTWRAADGSALKRNALRHTALPALKEAVGESVVESLTRTADLVRRDTSALDTIALREIQRMESSGDYVVEHGRISIHRRAVVELLPAITTRILRRAALDVGARAGELANVHIEEMERLARGEHGKRHTDMPGVVMERRGKLIVLTRINRME